MEPIYLRNFTNLSLKFLILQTLNDLPSKTYTIPERLTKFVEAILLVDVPQIPNIRKAPKTDLVAVGVAV